MMQCSQCRIRGKTWHGSDPKCAFVGPRWSRENWNCASDAMLREIATEHEQSNVWHYREEDQNIACLSLLEVAGCSGASAIWMTWYKNRGRTDNVLLLFHGDDPRPPTEDELMAVVRHYARGGPIDGAWCDGETTKCSDPKHTVEEHVVTGGLRYANWHCDTCGACGRVRLD